MKRYLFSAIVVIAVFALTVSLYAQPAGGGRGGFGGGAGGGMGGFGAGGGRAGGMMGGMRRGGGMGMLRAQTAEPGIAAIEEQLKVLKEIIAETPQMGGMRGGGAGEQDMQQMIEDMQARSEKTTTALNTIGDQLKVLKGGSLLQSELQESNDELAAIQQVATDENAEKTAKAIEDLIAKRSQALQDTMDKLGIRGGRGGRTGRGGQGGFGGGAGQGGFGGRRGAQ